MAEHLTEADLQHLLAPGVPVARAREAGAHVQGCAICTERFDAVRRKAAAGEHLDFDSELVPYAEGTLAGESGARTEQHLRGCTTCQAEVTDLRALIAARRFRRSRPSRRWLPVAIAAAAVFAVILLGPWFRSAPPPIAPVPSAHAALRDGAYVLGTPSGGYGRADWDGLAERALTTGRIDVTHRTDLQESADPLRGPDGNAPRVTLQPTGSVLDTPRPSFRWSGLPAGTYRISIHRLAGGAVMAGQRSSSTEWTPPRDLPRGETYVWQVTVQAGGEELVFPPPDQPQARFAILDAATSEAIADARRQGSHLIPALLLARAGAVDEARREIAQFAAENPASREAAALRAQLDRH